MLTALFSISGLAQAEKKILINLAARSLLLVDGNKRVALYPIGVGKVNTPTPTGYYKIMTKEVNPPWIDPSHPEYEVPSGANNPLGYRWMQIHGNYGIHGTNKPDSIGHYVSNGCIRMREADVEDLFDRVEIGTPVEITYNRVVVEKADDGRIVYYIYPDGYGWQNVDVKYVNSWLNMWGVGAFADDNEISKAISKSDGNAIYIGKAYTLEMDGHEIPATDQNGRHFDNKVVEREGITYLPAVPIAMALEMKLEWRHHTTLATRYGEVSGIERKGQLYINEDDANVLFRIEGWKEDNFYRIRKLGEEVEVYGSDGNENGTAQPSDINSENNNNGNNNNETLNNDDNQNNNDESNNNDVNSENSTDDNSSENEVSVDVQTDESSNTAA